ncbi:MAG: hypothetical protein ACLSUW_03230 [Akkermansia sp.]
MNAAAQRKTQEGRQPKGPETGIQKMPRLPRAQNQNNAKEKMASVEQNVEMTEHACGKLDRQVGAIADFLKVSETSNFVANDAVAEC